jgi:hypothetical protein
LSARQRGAAFADDRFESMRQRPYELQRIRLPCTFFQFGATDLRRRTSAVRNVVGNRRIKQLWLLNRLRLLFGGSKSIRAHLRHYRNVLSQPSGIKFGDIMPV